MVSINNLSVINLICQCADTDWFQCHMNHSKHSPSYIVGSLDGRQWTRFSGQWGKFNWMRHIPKIANQSLTVYQPYTHIFNHKMFWRCIIDNSAIYRWQCYRWCTSRTSYDWKYPWQFFADSYSMRFVFGKCDRNFKWVIFELISTINIWSISWGIALKYLNISLMIGQHWFR